MKVCLWGVCVCVCCLQPQQQTGHDGSVRGSTDLSPSSMEVGLEGSGGDGEVGGNVRGGDITTRP